MAQAFQYAMSTDVMIRRHLGPGPKVVLDCACGIGTQAIGLAACGHRVVATDLSCERTSPAAPLAEERLLVAVVALAGADPAAATEVLRAWGTASLRDSFSRRSA